MEVRSIMLPQWVSTRIAVSAHLLHYLLDRSRLKDQEGRGVCKESGQSSQIVYKCGCARLSPGMNVHCSKQFRWRKRSMIGNKQRTENKNATRTIGGCVFARIYSPGSYYFSRDTFGYRCGRDWHHALH